MITDEQYKKFFDLIFEFQKIQKKQKMRGFNDYNILNIVRNEYAEVGLHSRVLYSFLDPYGPHYQNDLFLSIFIKNVLHLTNFGDTLQVIVEREEQTPDERRIDFTIKNSNYYIGIEMKLNASDSYKQLFDYEQALKERAEKDNNQQVFIYYLTLMGTSAHHDSHQGIEYRTVSFKNDILPWIEKCQKEVYNITNLHQAFENYKWIVQKITNQYRSRVMSLAEYLNNTNIDIEEILTEIDNLQNETKKNFIQELLDKVEKNEFKKIEGQPNAIQKKYESFIIKLLQSNNECICQIFWEGSENRFCIQDKEKLQEDIKNKISKEVKPQKWGKSYDENSEKPIYCFFNITYNKEIKYQHKMSLFNSIEKDIDKIEDILWNFKKSHS